jgi:hypothetical protein
MNETLAPSSDRDDRCGARPYTYVRALASTYARRPQYIGPETILPSSTSV